jgi:N-acetylglutamate synthase-like GNAT family acetyltransferase
MIRQSSSNDLYAMYEIINDAAMAYKGVIPADRWHEPYMPLKELKREIAAGVEFWVYEDEKKEIIGVMGIQPVQDVNLIRHAYVRTKVRRGGIGTELLHELVKGVSTGILIGTWKDATWAIRFYEKNGFSLVTEDKKTMLLKKYWNIPDRQIETSVVLADKRWLKGRDTL